MGMGAVIQHPSPGPAFSGWCSPQLLGKQGGSGGSLGAGSGSGLQGCPGLSGMPSPAMSIPPWLEAILSAKAGVFHKNFPAGDLYGPYDLAEL